MQLMVEGDKWEMCAAQLWRNSAQVSDALPSAQYIPSELGYGDATRQPAEDWRRRRARVHDGNHEDQGRQEAGVQVRRRLARGLHREGVEVREEDGGSPSALDAEVKRLHGMAEKPMADKQLSWLNNRVHLLTKLIAKAPVEEIR